MVLQTSFSHWSGSYCGHPKIIVAFNVRPFFMYETHHSNSFINTDWSVEYLGFHKYSLYKQSEDNAHNVFSECYFMDYIVLVPLIQQLLPKLK